MFIERGADIVTGYPIAEGLKRATRSFLNVYKTYIGKHPELELQANVALRHFCYEGSMRGVCLLLWLGANPRANAPRKYGEAEDIWGCALDDAVCGGHLEIVKKIEINPQLDDLNKLLDHAAISKEAHLVQYLVEHGADPNHHDGDQWPLKTAAWFLWMTLDIHQDPRSPEVSRAVGVIQAMASGGAKFRPEDKATRELRRSLLSMEFHDALNLIKHLKQVGAAPDEVFNPLFEPPGIHSNWPYRKKALRRLFPKNDFLQPDPIR